MCYTRLMSFHAPKKSLGQNFLTSIPARIQIVTAGAILSTDTILEVGPGKGFLTKALLETGAHIVALEKDRDLLPLLSETFSSEIASNRLTLIEGDVLDFNPEQYFSIANSGLKPIANSQQPIAVPYKLIANIPYYITGAILSKFLSHTYQPSIMVVLVQKEVAERVCARDGKVFPNKILRISIMRRCSSNLFMLALLINVSLHSLTSKLFFQKVTCLHFSK